MGSSMENKAFVENTISGGKQQSTRTFALPSGMTIETIETLAAEFKQMLLAEKSCLTLDASQVGSITTPALQMMVSLEKTLCAQGGSLDFSGQSEAFIQACKDAGLESLLATSP